MELKEIFLGNAIKLLDDLFPNPRPEDEISKLRYHLTFAQETMLKIQEENMRLSDEIKDLRKKLSIKNKYAVVKVFGSSALAKRRGLHKRMFNDVQSIREAEIDLVCHRCAEKEGLEIVLDEKTEWVTTIRPHQETFFVCSNCGNRIIIETGF